MTRSLLIRGMIAGVIAGVLVFLYARFFGEPNVDGAIAFEGQMEQAMGEMAEPELVSRAVQASWGLLTGVMLYAIAVGGLFSLLFAFALGRMGRLGARPTAALLAAASFVAVYVVPFVKYPANPPSVGNADTIGVRTVLYFGMIVISVASMVVAINLARMLLGRMERWHAFLISGAVYLALVILAGVVMPPINEVPDAFPATLLWSFRLSALVMQVILWTALGVVFGELAERQLAHAGQLAARPAT